MKKSIFILLMALVITSCAGREEFIRGKDYIAEGRAKQGLQSIEEAGRLDPSNMEYRAASFREKEKIINGLLEKGDRALLDNDLDEAEAVYNKILNIDAANSRGISGAGNVKMMRRHKILLAEANELFKRNDIDGVQARIKRVLDENPGNREAKILQERVREASAKVRPGSGLREAYRKPVTLEFRDTALRSVFELLSRTSEINFMFDKDVRPDLRVTIFVRNTSIEEAIRYLLVTNQLAQRVLNDNTVLIYPNTAAKNGEYQELVVKSFYIGNADVKQTLSMIKAIVKTKDVYVDEKLNLLVMRDTPDALRLAQKLIANQDLAEPEVMLELEVLEIGTNKLQELGIRYPDSVSASVSGAAGVAGSLTLPEFRQFNSGMVTLNVNNPLVIANLKRTVTEQNLLANPRIRVRNREKARIHIGEKVPVITTTSTANVGISESVNYLDVGLKLEIEPNIYLDDEVAMKVGLEVSSILDTVTRASGLQTYRLGARNASTVLRLRDNETQILAGLIQRDERMSANRVPGLGDIPLIGRLFSSQLDNNTKTEIVLLITPRVIRNIARLPIDATEFSSGTELAAGAAALTLNPSGLSSISSNSTPPLTQVAPSQAPSQPSSSSSAPPPVSIPRAPNIGVNPPTILPAN